MQFSITLDTSACRRVEHEPVMWAPELEDWALPLCEVLEQSGVRFLAGGFGDDSWPVDVRFDLTTVLPQLPVLIRSLETGVDTELDFYEQGIQRTVTVRVAPRRVTLLCTSSGDWQPPTPLEEQDRRAFAHMVLTFAHAVADAVALAVPEVAESTPFPDWRRRPATEVGLRPDVDFGGRPVGGS